MSLRKSFENVDRKPFGTRAFEFGGLSAQQLHSRPMHQQIRWGLFEIICDYLVIYKLFVIICN